MRLKLCLLFAVVCGLTTQSSGFSPTEIRSSVQLRNLFSFAGENALSDWQIVNDGVMGGRSQSQVRRGTEGEMKFSGVLSLANNGGFASTRSRATQLGLKQGDTIVLRVKGDGRKYTFNAYVPRRRMAFSYRTEFQTSKDQCVDVRIPVSQLVATSFGRVVRGATLDPAEVNSVGILLGDKKPGAFQIMIKSIDVESTSESDSTISKGL